MTNTDFFHVGQRLTDSVNIDMVVEKVAYGGFGAIAMGPDRVNGGEWRAVKTLRPDLLAKLSDETQYELHVRFLREALSWRGFSLHPNVVTAQLVTKIEGSVMLVLEYAEEGSLQDLFDFLVSQKRWLTVTHALNVAQQIAAGIVTLHTPAPKLLRQSAIVHRDLKPANILLSNGLAKVTDFGLSKAVAESIERAYADVSSSSETEALQAVFNANMMDNSTQTLLWHTQHGVGLGTPLYMAPECWYDASLVGTPADAYAFGVILAQLLTGQHPLVDSNHSHIVDWQQIHAIGHPIPLRRLGTQLFALQQDSTVGEADKLMQNIALERLENLIEKLLAKQPEIRPELAEVLAELQVAAMTFGSQPYVPPEDYYPDTPAEEMIFWMGWAGAYEQFGLHTEALERITRALGVAPEDPRVLSVYAGILFGLGESESALDVCLQSLAGYSVVLTVQPDAEITGYESTFSNYCQMLHALHRYDDAEIGFAKMTEIWPRDANTWGYRALNQKDWAKKDSDEGNKKEAHFHIKQARKFIQRAVSLSPYDPRFRELEQLLRIVNKFV